MVLSGLGKYHDPVEPLLFGDVRIGMGSCYFHTCKFQELLPFR